MICHILITELHVLCVDMRDNSAGLSEHAVKTQGDEEPTWKF